MGRNAKLTGDSVYLAPVSPEDAELWARWLNDLDVALPLGDEAYGLFTAEDQTRDISDIVAHHDHVVFEARLQWPCRLIRKIGDLDDSLGHSLTQRHPVAAPAVRSPLGAILPPPW